ncbi:DMT family transporter [Candidatus Saccharibacteria bacterium]|nr:DMT family transporter [Candidatus Saccharibacteria bacterium]
MSWQVLIILQTVIIAFSTISIRALTRQKSLSNSVLALNGIQSVVYYVGILCLLPFIGSIQFGKIHEFLPFLVAAGLLLAGSNACGFKVLSHLDAGFGTILGTLGAVFTIIFAAIVLGEELNLTQAIGSVILLLGVCYGLLIARQHHKGKKNHRAWLWGLIFAVFSGLFIALALVDEKYLLGHMNGPTLMFYAVGFQMLGSLLLGAMFEPKGYRLIKNKSVMRLNILGGSFRSVSAVLFIIALVKSNNVALVGVIEQFKLVVIIILAALILKERDRLGQKLMAACVAILGLVIIFWK